METVFPVGSPQAVKKYSTLLCRDVVANSYWQSRFMGYGEAARTPMQVLDELESDQGDTVQFNLLAQVTGDAVYGDDWLEGNVKKLSYYESEIKINRIRQPVSGGGAMSRKRTILKTREHASESAGVWGAQYFDQAVFMYLAGSRGVNTNYVVPANWSGIPNTQGFLAPSSSSQYYGGTATSKATVTNTDIMTLGVIERLSSIASSRGGGNEGVPAIQPCQIGGEDVYIMVMHPNQEYQMRTAATPTGGTGWLDVQKALVSFQGEKSPLMKGGLGMHNSVIMHKHKNVVKFNDYGAGANLAASRASLMGVQAMVCAFGQKGTKGLRWKWTETPADLDKSQAIITVETICGIQRTQFNGKDFGVLHVDTYAPNP